LNDKVGKYSDKWGREKQDRRYRSGMYTCLQWHVN